MKIQMNGIIVTLHPSSK